MENAIHWCLNSNPKNKILKKLPNTDIQAFKVDPSRSKEAKNKLAEIERWAAEEEALNDQVRLNEKEQPLPVVEQTPEDDPYRYAKGTNPLPARELKTMDREFLAYIDDLTNSKFDFSMMNLYKL